MERLRYLFLAFLWMLTAGRASELQVFFLDFHEEDWKPDSTETKGDLGFFKWCGHLSKGFPNTYTCALPDQEELKVSQPGYLGISSMGNPALECAHNSNNDAELKLTILKGSEKSVVCSGTTSSSMQTASSSELLHCIFERIPNKVSVMIRGLNSSLIDNYFCKIEKLYPPPYESNVGNGTIIYIKPEDMKCPQFSFLLVMGILAPLLLVCMVSIIILITKNKEKKTNVNPVYEQMAPTRGR